MCLICHWGWGVFPKVLLSAIIWIIFTKPSTLYLQSPILHPTALMVPQHISWDLPSICLSTALLSRIALTVLPFCGCLSCRWSPVNSNSCICVGLVLFLWNGVAMWFASITGFVGNNPVPWHGSWTQDREAYVWKGYLKKESPHSSNPKENALSALVGPGVYSSLGMVFCSSWFCLLTFPLPLVPSLLSSRER